MSLSEMRARMSTHLETLIGRGPADVAWPPLFVADSAQRQEQLARDQLKRIMKTLEHSGPRRQPGQKQCKQLHWRAQQTLMNRHYHQWSRASGRLDYLAAAESSPSPLLVPYKQRTPSTAGAPLRKASPPQIDRPFSVIKRRRDSAIVADAVEKVAQIGETYPETVEFLRPNQADIDEDDDDDGDGEDKCEPVDEWIRRRSARSRCRLSSSTSKTDVEVAEEHATLLFYKMPGENRILRQILQQAGFSRHRSGSAWDLNWIGSRTPIRIEIFRHLRRGQKINRFPLLEQITRKDSLFINVARMQDHHASGNPYCFIPETFLLPTDADKLDRTYHSQNHRTSAWIVKPHASCQGRGIFVTRQLTDIPNHSHLVVSRYIAHPYLIQGRKFDIRLYVTVTSFDPLRIYVHEEGLLRFATEPFTMSDASLSNPFVHLTNYSINKNSSSFVRNSDADHDDCGHKWSVTALRRHLRQRGVNERIVFHDIYQVIVKTIVAIEDQVVHAIHQNVHVRDACFCLLGFDILLDATLRPWLLEVNGHPSLTSDTPLDYKVKSTVLADLLNMIGLRQDRIPTRDATRYRAASPSYWLRGRNKSDAAMMHELLSLESQQEYERRRGWVRVFPFAGGIVHKPLFGITRDVNMYMCKKAGDEHRHCQTADRLQSLY